MDIFVSFQRVELGSDKHYEKVLGIFDNQKDALNRAGGEGYVRRYQPYKGQFDHDGTKWTLDGEWETK